jgi:hypothetical protein
VAGRTPPAGERGSAAGSLLSSHYPNCTWACVLCRPSPELPFHFVWFLGYSIDNLRYPASTADPAALCLFEVMRLATRFTAPALGQCGCPHWNAPKKTDRNTTRDTTPVVPRPFCRVSRYFSVRGVKNTTTNSTGTGGIWLSYFLGL